MLQDPPDRPEKYTALLKRSFNLFNYSFRRTIALSLLFSLIVFVPRLLSILLNQPQLVMYSTFSLESLWLAAVDVCAFLVFVALLWRIHCAAINKHESLIEDFSTALHKILTIIAAIILQLAILFLIGFINAIVQAAAMYLGLFFQANISSIVITCMLFFIQLFLGLYVSFLFYFYLPLIVIENDGVIFSLKRSAQLVWGNFFRTIILQLTPWIIYLLALILTKIALQINMNIYLFDYSFNPTTSSLPGIATHLIIFACFIPWVVSCILVQLYDLELRKNTLSPNEKARRLRKSKFRIRKKPKR